MFTKNWKSNHTCNGKCFDGTYYNPVMDNQLGYIPEDTDPCMNPTYTVKDVRWPDKKIIKQLILSNMWAIEMEQNSICWGIRYMDRDYEITLYKKTERRVVVEYLYAKIMDHKEEA
jgi:hypothetical protein